MNELEELQEQIERSRIELDNAFETGKFEEYYEKSIILDNLIEEYLQVKNSAKIL